MIEREFIKLEYSCTYWVTKRANLHLISLFYSLIELTLRFTKTIFDIFASYDICLFSHLVPIKKKKIFIWIIRSWYLPLTTKVNKKIAAEILKIAIVQIYKLEHQWTSKLPTEFHFSKSLILVNQLFLDLSVNLLVSYS